MERRKDLGDQEVETVIRVYCVNLITREKRERRSGNGVWGRGKT